MNEKEVDFFRYCKQCKFFTTPGYSDPCDECLGQPVNENSKKPVYFQEVKNSAKRSTRNKECRKTESQVCRNS